ncbi:MAG: beta-lactamase-like protein [Gammaproteobacteria bacterium]|jgi:ribonuclease BN (tRNA processing enzyme)|nr:beta-lactamase-like protein [Gammaproteobacteria bacterium]
MRTLIMLLIAGALAPAGAIANPCTGHGVEVQVLGSGGPELEDKRASSSYLVWQDGRPRILIDSGGGSALRFGQAGAHVAQLDAILFTHLHVDHSADFPALMKSSYFEERSRPLPVYGPGGNEVFPATTEFVADLFDRKRGMYRYLGDFLAGNEGGYALQAHDLNLEGREIRAVFSEQHLAATATRVVHGDVPALAWRISVGRRTIAFSGDTNGDNGNLERLAKGADIFVAHNAVPEGETGAARRLHMPPSVIGRIAKEAGVGRIILSHRMLRTLGREAETQAAIAKAYSGPVTFADDLDCFR